MKTMSLVHAGYRAENYTGEMSPVFKHKITALWWAIINGPGYYVREVKEPSAISPT